MGAAPGHTTAKLQHCLDLIRAGDGQARHELLNHACDRLRRLTRRMLKGFPGVLRWEQTDDVLQNALMRLYRALADVRPESVRHFCNLAALQIRRELLDLTKHHFGPEGQGAKHRSDACRAPGGPDGPLQTLPDAAEEPETLDAWTEFHSQVESLPAEEREVFNLLWYEGLSQQEAAGVLAVSPRTVMRLWQTARLMIYQALNGDKPW